MAVIKVVTADGTKKAYNPGKPNAYGSGDYIAEAVWAFIKIYHPGVFTWEHLSGHSYSFTVYPTGRPNLHKEGMYVEDAMLALLKAHGTKIGFSLDLSEA